VVTRLLIPVLLIAAAGCGHARGTAHVVEPAEAPSSALAWRDAATPGDDDVPARPPFVAPGERMMYRVTMHGVDVASFALAAGDVVDLGGRRAVIVQSGVQSGAMLSMVRKVANTFTSWIDVATGRPLLFRSEELAGSADEATEAVEASFQAATAGAVPMHVARSDGGDRVESQTAAGTLHDLNSFLIVLRGWDASPGTSAALDVVRSRFAWRTQVTVGGFETVVTALGEMPALRFDGVSRRLTRAGGIDDKIEPRHYSVWISDDADRVPVLLVAHTDYGDIRMEIVDYTPGSRGSLGAPASGAQLGDAKR
jgi:hypothetical protein